MVKSIAHVHMEHSIKVKLNVDTVLNHVIHVSIMKTNVKFVWMDMKIHQNVP